MKILSLIFALLVVLSCSNEDNTLMCDEKATIRDFTGVDGCSYVLVLDDEKVLEIGDLEFEPDFQFRDGLRVSVTYEELSSSSVCMVGSIVRVLCIDPI